MVQNKEISADRIDEYRLQIEQDFPDLTIGDLKPIGSGWDHVALAVNDRTGQTARYH